MRAALQIQIQESAAKAKTPYDISMPLLAAALTNDKAAYPPLRDKMLQASNTVLLHNKPPRDMTEKAWLLGRILVAANSMQDQETVEFTKKILINILKTVRYYRKDACVAWAWGYLQVYNATQDPKAYTDNKLFMLKYTQELVNERNPAPGLEPMPMTNILWAEVMDLQAAAAANDRATYQEILKDILTVTGTNTIVEAFQQMPIEDYRAWAMASVGLAASQMKNEETLELISGAITKVINDSPSSEDKMLAQATWRLVPSPQAQLSQSSASAWDSTHQPEEPSKKEHVSSSTGLGQSN